MKNLADFVIFLSLLAIFFSVLGAAGRDLWLASTQWMLIAATLAIYAIYLRLKEKK